MQVRRVHPTLLAVAAALCLLYIVDARSFSASKKEYKKVLFDDVKALTFYRNKETLARRTDPIPQLRCIGRPCAEFQPNVVQCTSRGNAQWKVCARYSHLVRGRNARWNQFRRCASFV